jgi:hypothetical protein
MGLLDIDQANRTALERMTGARPILRAVRPASEAVPGMRPNLLLHAGPPIEWDRMSGPMRGAVIGALMYEGLAGDEAAAVERVLAGEVEFSPCHHHRSVGPMAGVTSYSMMVYEVENVTHGNQAYSNLNEGYGKVLRYGAFSPEVLAKLRWINETMGPMLAEALSNSDGLDIRALVACAGRRSAAHGRRRPQPEQGRIADLHPAAGPADRRSRRRGGGKGRGA